METRVSFSIKMQWFTSGSTLLVVLVAKTSAVRSRSLLDIHVDQQPKYVLWLIPTEVRSINPWKLQKAVT